MPPPSPRNITLKKLAAILALICGISFGFCGLAATIGMDNNQTLSGYIIYASFVVESLCLLGLILIAGLAVMQAIRRRNQPRPPFGSAGSGMHES